MELTPPEWATRTVPDGVALAVFALLPLLARRASRSRALYYVVGVAGCVVFSVLVVAYRIAPKDGFAWLMMLAGLAQGFTLQKVSPWLTNEAAAAYVAASGTASFVYVHYSLYGVPIAAGTALTDAVEVALVLLGSSALMLADSREPTACFCAFAARVALAWWSRPLDPLVLLDARRSAALAAYAEIQKEFEESVAVAKRARVEYRRLKT